MAIDVEDRHEEQVRARENIFMSPPEHDVPQEHEARVLPVDLASMDARLREQRGPAVRAQGLGRCAAALSRDHHPDIAPLRALADRDERDVVGDLVDAAQPRDRLVVARRLAETAPLARRDPRIARAGHQCAALSLPRKLRREDRQLAGIAGERRGGARAHDGGADDECQEARAHARRIRDARGRGNYAA